MNVIHKIHKFAFEKRYFKELDNVVGVYIFFDKNKKPLYVGKSRNLKARLLSYKAKGLIGKTKTLIEQTKYFSYLEVNSEIESLLLEASLVKKIMPKYNIELKDDKSPLYIRITSEKYPRVLTARKSQLDKHDEFYIGPFTSSETVKSILRMVRKIFPYSVHVPGRKVCIYAQMGMCNPCPSMVENTSDIKIKKDLYQKYLRNIRLIKKLLSGSLKSIYKDLNKEMREYIKKEEFELANEIKKRIEILNYITHNVTNPKKYIENPNLIYDLRQSETDDLFEVLQRFIPELKKVDNIECYDVAHLSGVFPTASMVSFVKGSPNKKMYRRFRIQQKQGNNDLASMSEVARRRSLHFEGDAKTNWGKPDLILVDGGKTQTRVFFEVMRPYGVSVVGLAKRFETLIIPIDLGDKVKFVQYILPDRPAKSLVQRIRDEAHRFARHYHHHLLAKNLLN